MFKDKKKVDALADIFNNLPDTPNPVTEEDVEDIFTEKLDNKDTTDDKKDEKDSDSESESESKKGFHNHPKFRKMKSKIEELEEQISELQTLKENNNDKDESGSKETQNLLTAYEKFLDLTGAEDSAESKANFLKQSDLINDLTVSMRESLKKELKQEIEGIKQSIGEESRLETKYTQQIKDMLDYVEEEYSLDMSKPEVRNGVLSSLKRISPKDESGNVVEFGDIDAAVEVYKIKNSTNENDTYRKSLSSRSMSNRSNSNPNKSEEIKQIPTDAKIGFFSRFF